MELIRNPKDRELVRLVEESRFITSSDLYLIDGRRRQVVSGALKELRQAKYLSVIYSAQRLPQPSFFARKTYILGERKSPRGHIQHWLHVAHLRALFTKAARELGISLGWSQSNKHKEMIPDSLLTVCGKTWSMEVDNSTERMRMDRIAGKLANPVVPTLVVAFSSKERLKSLARGVGQWDKTLLAVHGYFHPLEPDFNILTEPCWWNGTQWISLIRPPNPDPNA